MPDIERSDNKVGVKGDGLTLMDFMPTPVSSVGEGFKAEAGDSLKSGQALASGDDIIEAIKQVYDPEIPVNVYDLGLILSQTQTKNGDVEIEMTLTAPGCPVAGEMPGMVSRAVAGIEGVGKVTTHLVFHTPWDKSRMSEDAKMALDII